MLGTEDAKKVTSMLPVAKHPLTLVFCSVQSFVGRHYISAGLFNGSSNNFQTFLNVCDSPVSLDGSVQGIFSDKEELVGLLLKTCSACLTSYE